MFPKRNFLVVIFIIALAGIIALPFFHCNHSVKATYHRFLETEEFKQLSRKEQVDKCGSCHKQEYENELKGPHSHAYQMLKEHKAFVNSPLYDCDFYTRQVNGDF